jgi:hypothetical protein
LRWRERLLSLGRRGWHLSGRLIVPPNITLIPLPAQCPARAEPAGKRMAIHARKRLSNQIFKSFDDIVDRC